jgi:hypothetical protein
MRNRFLSILFVAMLLGVGCSDDSSEPFTPPKDEVPEDAAPDFSLFDVNTTSPTAGEQVSPRDHLRKVSAWYFGHAT